MPEPHPKPASTGAPKRPAEATTFPPERRAASVAYDRAYFESHLGERPYAWGEAVWEEHFARFAQEVEQNFHPATVFDAGCGVGFLVGALRDLGIDARGADVSEWALAQAPEGIRDRLAWRSVTEPIAGGPYDLVICIEVLEHLSETEGLVAVKQLTAATDRVLFSSTPDDKAEPSHLNVQPAEYWIRAFAGEGFVPRQGLDLSFAAPWAILLERGRA